LHAAALPADVSIKNAIMGDGSMVKAGAKIANSIIGLRSLIGENCDIQDTLMLGSDYYETLDECAFVPGCLPMGIGAGSVVRKALIDKNARIGENVKILNKEGVVENLSTESQGYVIRDGIVVSVPLQTVLPIWEGHVLRQQRVCVRMVLGRVGHG
jgi:glucose-1-phosphate adenylyltransferase